MDTIESLGYVEKNDGQIKSELIKYCRTMSLELYKKGPKRIELVFDHDGYNITVYEPYNKTEIALIEMNDPILIGSILTIRHRVCHLFSKEFEESMGKIIGQRIKMLTPQFDIEKMTNKYEFKYIKNKINDSSMI